MFLRLYMCIGTYGGGFFTVFCLVWHTCSDSCFLGGTVPHYRIGRGWLRTFGYFSTSCLFMWRAVQKGYGGGGNGRAGAWR